MTYNFKQLTHPGIQSLRPYVPGKSLTDIDASKTTKPIIKLASNENVLGCSQRAIEALKALDTSDASLYATSISNPFRSELAQHLGVSTDMLTISNGSDAIISHLLTCFALNSDKHILTHDYAFVAYVIQAKTRGIETKSAPVNNWQVDIDAILNMANEKTALVFLANPNNPTGGLVAHQDIKKLITNLPKTTILVVDEAYYEYAATAYGGNSIDLLKQHPNLVIMRTFSKAYGLAGLRIGYCISCPEISELLYSVQLPFAVNVAAMRAASAALTDQDFVKKTIQMNTAGLQQMQQGLDTIGIEHLKASGNFITINCRQDAKVVADTLEQDNILTRPLHPSAMPNYLRITIGTAKQNAAVLHKLQSIIK